MSSVLAAAGISAALKEIKEGFDECVQASMDFESAITGVAKTTDLTDEELADMSDAIKAMSTEIPASTTEIAAVAEAAGQLGIQKDALLDFTRVMTMLGTATNMTAEDAATALARFANITGMSADNYDRLGAVIVDLGNNFATTESEITQMGTRLASGGKLAGLTEPQIMALAAAMSSVGIEAEAGGTAMTQTLNAIEKAVATGEDSLQSFADVAGMSADSFAEMWNTDALGALTAFIRGLGNLDEQGESAVLVLEDLGLTGIRQSNTHRAGVARRNRRAWAETRQSDRSRIKLRVLVLWKLARRSPVQGPQESRASRTGVRSWCRQQEHRVRSGRSQHSLRRCGSGRLHSEQDRKARRNGLQRVYDALRNFRWRRRPERNLPQAGQFLHDLLHDALLPCYGRI